MDLELSADEQDLVAAVRRMCEGLFPLERVRELERAGRVDSGSWEGIAKAGVFSLRLPEESGGAGLGMTHAALVFEELGRALVPGPLVCSHLAAGLVDGCAGGSRVATLVERPAPGQRPGVALVENLHSADTLLVLDDDGVWEVATRGLEAEALEPLDPLTPVHSVTSLPRGDKLGGRDVAARWRLEGPVLVAALLLGLAEGSSELATSYAKQREQFGRTIGSFQAVKHLLADMLVRAEVARAAVYAAGATLDDPGAGEAERAVAVAKLVAGEAAVANGRASVQVHGGMGFTWEVAAHLYLKRSMVLEEAFGPGDTQAERIASLLTG